MSARQDSLKPLRWPLTVVSHAPGQQELLLRSVDGATDIQPGASWLRVQWVVDVLPVEAPDPEPGEAVVWLARRGAWCGLYRPPNVMGLQWPVVPIHEMFVAGPGQQRVRADASLRPTRQTGAESGSVHGWWLTATTDRDDHGIYSRTAGAIGWPAVEQLRQLRIGLVGAGRTGEAMAKLLASHSMWQLMLVDPDVVEPGNADVGLLGAAWRSAGMAALHKVDALASQLAPLAPHTRFIPIARSVLSPAALTGLASCDVIVSTVDNDLARLACACIASAYHRVHLDLGSLVTTDAGGARLLGADCRLILPGRCLSCLGAFAQDRLEPFALGETVARIGDWRSEKRGALSSWSAITAGLGLRLLEDLSAERVSASTWVRMTQADGDVAPHIQQLTADPDRYCPICACAGWGGDVLHRIPALAAAVVVRMKRRGEMASG
ncbi:MAG: ThiF family adenylyltransferase [Burkholderiaceae bacterium]